MTKWQFRVEKNEDDYSASFFFLGQIPKGTMAAILKAVVSAGAFMAIVRQYIY